MITGPDRGWEGALWMSQGHTVACVMSLNLESSPSSFIAQGQHKSSWAKKHEPQKAVRSQENWHCYPPKRANHNVLPRPGPLSVSLSSLTGSLISPGWAVILDASASASWALELHVCTIRPSTIHLPLAVERVKREGMIWCTWSSWDRAPFRERCS